MTSGPRFLISTALEDTWRHDCPVLFLGEWTRRYTRRHIWQKMDAFVAEPFGLTEPQRERNFEYLQLLSDRILGELTVTLNRLHGTAYSVRYWRIILGHWLTRYLCYAFNRYFTLEQALNRFEISGAAILGFKSYSLATRDSLNFIWACNDDVWNHVFYAKILAFRGDIAVEVRMPSKEVSRFSLVDAGVRRRNGVRGSAVAAARAILPKLSHRTDAFILNTHLPFRQEAALQLMLGQFPQIWSSPPLQDLPPDSAMRVQMTDVSGFTGFDCFARLLLPEVIPVCYVEGYAALRETVARLPWPAEPKFIYTASNFDLDEVFKAWTASKVEKGVPYLVGQHGAGYGTHKYFQTKYSPERATTDGFLTWGWSDGTPKTISGFLFNAADLKPVREIGKGDLLLIEASMLNQITHWDNYYEFGLYQEEQFRFAAALPAPIREGMTVRLHGSHKKFDWADVQRWHDYDAAIKVASSGESIVQQIGESRLVVYAYDSTGILECLNLNIPTMGFWREGLAHLLPEARPHYQSLVDSGILHFDPEETARYLASVWDNISAWWLSDRVQKARTAFCAQYAKSSIHPVRELKALLKKDRKN
jgi:putative transferase (TIGR04331 family)